MTILLPVTVLLAASSQDHSDHVQDVMVALATIAISSFVAWITAQRAIKGEERRADSPDSTLVWIASRHGSQSLTERGDPESAVAGFDAADHSEPVSAVHGSTGCSAKCT